MRILVCVALVLMLAGCAAFGSSNSVWKDMTAEQIKAAVSDKSASIVCVSGLYAGATVNTLAINVDKGTPSNLTIDQGCKVTFGSVMPTPRP